MNLCGSLPTHHMLQTRVLGDGRATTCPAFTRHCTQRSPVITQAHVIAAVACPTVRLAGSRPRRHVAAQAQSEPAAAAAAATTRVPDAYIEEADAEIAAFQAHQKAAAKLAPAEQARTLLCLVKNAVLTTVSTKQEAAGLPFGSVIEFAASPEGRPLFAASSLSPLTKDLLANPGCCLTVVASNYQGPQDARLSLSGAVRKLEGQEAAAAREAFLAVHPGSFWVDFGDFSWWALDNISLAWLVAGFGGGRKITAEELAAAQPDPVAAFSAPVCGHMNADHEEDTRAMVAHYVGMKVEGARMLGLDRLGMDLEVKRGGEAFKLRLPFVRPAEDRKGIKEAIVEMTRAARSAAPKAAPADSS